MIICTVKHNGADNTINGKHEGYNAAFQTIYYSSFINYRKFHALLHPMSRGLNQLSKPQRVK